MESVGQTALGIAWLGETVSACGSAWQGYDAAASSGNLELKANNRMESNRRRTFALWRWWEFGVPFYAPRLLSAAVAHSKRSISA
jgi:hypothetical protein